MSASSMRLAALTLLLAILVSCAGSAPVHFYTLSVEAPAAGSDPSGKAIRIAVGSIALPEVVDRPQMVVRSGPNQVNLVEEHRWAESLKGEIPRVIAENLSRLLSTDQVWAYPQQAKVKVDYRVSVDIQRFDSIPGENVAIEALWSVKRVSQEADESKVGRSNVRQPVSGQGYETLAEAHSRALAAISGEIAEAIRLFARQSS